jgi:hypothetical protein
MPIHSGRVALKIVSIGTAVLLAACGSSTLMVITGTAAKGAPLAGSVEATCATGTGTATVNATTGSYTVNVFDGAGPCLLALTPSGGGNTLFSVTTGTGSSVVANITPLTNMFVQSFLLGLGGATSGKSSPTEWFAQPAAKSLLSNTTAVANLVTNNFLPALDSLPSGLGTTFLDTAFTPQPGDTQDNFLEALSTGPNAVFNSSTLQPAPVVSTTIVTAAEAAPDVPTETTGGSFVSGGGN